MSTVDIPEWITETYIEDILKQNHDDELVRDEIEIIKYDVISGTPKGNNYMSDIYRIVISYKILHKSDNNLETFNNISLIVKAPLKVDAMISTVKRGLYQKEFQVYYELLPKIHSILLSLENETLLAPKTFYHKEENVLILEDLKPSGYELVKRTNQFDFDHGILILKYLAKFHAASVKLHEIEPNIVEQVGKDLIFGQTGVEGEKIKETFSSSIGETHIELLCQEFEKWPETKKYVNFLRKLKKRIWDILCDSLRSGKDEFVVMNHGDLWLGNIMFKYDSSSKPCDMRFLDFQVSRLTSPAVDIIRLLHVSIKYDIFKMHYEDFIRYYINTLNEYLEKFDSYKRLSLDEFREALNRRDLFSLVQILNILPIVLATDPQNGNSEEDSSKDLIPKNLHQNKEFRNICVKHLQDYSKRDWFQQI